MMLKHLQSVVIHGNFDGLNDFYDCIHAGIEISEPLHLWLKNTKEDTILRQIICWLAAIYRFDEKREIMNEQLYLPVLEEVKEVSMNYFNFKIDLDSLTLDAIRKMYHRACLSYYGSMPPKLLWEPIPFDPYYSSEAKKWGSHTAFNISISRFYFQHRDWKRIILDGEDDNLLRCESSKEHWIKIKHQYVSSVDETNTFSLYSAPSEKGNIYLIQAEDTGHYKIGYTRSDPYKRLAQLQTGNSHILTLVGSFPCSGIETERLLHNIFANVRLSGEWFNLNDLEIKNILNEEWRINQSIH